MFLNKNLRFLRKHKNDGLSQENLANVLNVSRAALVAYEKGYAEPRLSILNTIAEFFEVTIEELINIDLEERHSKQQALLNVPPPIGWANIIRIWKVDPC